ncbi:TetR family transcriptional regulator C-terminal domain-containing protein [Radiobacillus kanasensis]|uniref:TetR/AcrR family transcriptional regulator n=1 Tax=Radiobacillus kanasensis TaxID=2844358 RepID=UPI001E2DB6F0|nr:TetR family transcriptional regulator C-terminal domain-containing protein [Radiobacillus kanasensis]UFT98323.1 TetR family transcriptional regulator C-terminal domain-containing protein [Radiobacillus kanasensis]
MPKKVDHLKRKRQIAEATWRVILEKGIEHASVRNIAKEANLSLGALRYYFSSQDQLLAYAMDLVKERATERIQQIVSQDIPLKVKVIQALMEMVPTSKETRAEMEIWFSFLIHIRHKKEQRKIDTDGVYAGIQILMHTLQENNMLKDGIDLDLEAEALYSLVDGLAIHALFDPTRIPQEKVKSILSSYMERLYK